MDTPTFTIVKEQYDLELLERSDGKFTVVHRTENQVQDAMPGDAPQGGGYWQARYCNAGIAYVSTGYSESYARRIFRERVQEYNNTHDNTGEKSWIS